MKTQTLAELTAREKRLVAMSLRGSPPATSLHKHTFSGRHIKFGYYSDAHVGQKHFKEPLWHLMTQKFIQEGIRVVYSPGDNLEGMSGRPGHIYELAQIGASAQLDKATELFLSEPRLHYYIIDGNHDQWFKEKNNAGFTSGKELAHRCKNVTFLGEWEATVQLHENVKMLLFHANDGTA